jgi:methylthioxylose transferase
VLRSEIDCRGGTGPARPAQSPSDRRYTGVRRDLVGAVVGAALVGAAFLVPHLHDAAIAPVVNPARWGYYDFADAAPLFGWRNVHTGWGTPCAVAIGAAVVLWGPRLAHRLPWRPLLAVTWMTALMWAVALALIDGWDRGFASKFRSPDEYPHEVRRFDDIRAALHDFARRIPDYQPESWNTQVSGHPPGAALVFVMLDRIGMGGATWAAVVCTAAGTSAAAAILVTLRALGDGDMARRAAPFLALAPAAIWIAVSADAFFTGVAAWGMALLAMVAGRTVRWPLAAAIGSGVLLGFGAYLSYGLILMVVPAAAVLMVAGTARPLVGAVVGVLAVAATFTVFGFWWFDGYAAVKVRYYQGVAADRPYVYWVWANYASLLCAVGLATSAAFPRLVSWPKLRALRPLNIILVAFVLAVTVADLSGLSKAETERIWLPFAIWILSAPALLPPSGHRFWLTVQTVGALAINHLILTNW